MRIVVLGYIVRGPVGGLAWHHLQYVMGLRDLGHDVYFLEDSDDYPSCYDPSRGVTTADPSYGLRFTAETFARVGLSERWAYYDAHSDVWLGPAGPRALEVCATADVVLNVSHVNPVRSWLQEVPVRVLIDTDPVFTQVKILTDKRYRERANSHTDFFTFAENIGSRSCSVPTAGLEWKPTRQPVVRHAWPVVPPGGGALTSVMQWDSYRPVTYNGQTYGMKSLSFGPYLDLPETTGAHFDLAVGSATAPTQSLLDRGWTLRNPLSVTATPWTYQRYIQESRAEFGIAKHGYVVSHSGWFSERSAAYLASGRPVIVQDTGFTEWLPGGTGVLPFTSPHEVVMAIEDLDRRYADHCDAALRIVDDYFSAPDVLTSLLHRAQGRVGSSAGPLPEEEDACL